MTIVLTNSIVTTSRASVWITLDVTDIIDKNLKDILEILLNVDHVSKGMYYVSFLVFHELNEVKIQLDEKKKEWNWIWHVPNIYVR